MREAKWQSGVPTGNHLATYRGIRIVVKLNPQGDPVEKGRLPPQLSKRPEDQCSTRRHHGDCEQTMTPAQPLEEQLIDWLHDFQPDPELRRLILDTIQAETGRTSRR